jgi:hypothetical protein
MNCAKCLYFEKMLERSVDIYRLISSSKTRNAGASDRQKFITWQRQSRRDVNSARSELKQHQLTH